MRQAVPLSFSPDGSELLVSSDVPGSDQLFVWPGMRQVTFDEGKVTGQFLPDGRILVERDEGGNERVQLYVGDEPLIVDPRYKHETPHAAGRTLAYATTRRNGVDFDIVARDLESGEERTSSSAATSASRRSRPTGGGSSPIARASAAATTTSISATSTPGR